MQGREASAVVPDNVQARWGSNECGGFVNRKWVRLGQGYLKSAALLNDYLVVVRKLCYLALCPVIYIPVSTAPDAS